MPASIRLSHYARQRQPWWNWALLNRGDNIGAELTPRQRRRALHKHHRSWAVAARRDASCG